MKQLVSKQLLSKIYVLFILLFGAYLAFQLIEMANPDLRTEQAILQQVEDKFTATGFLVRSEVQIENRGAGDGYIRFDVRDGARVAGGGKIATVFSSPESLELSLEISRLNSVAEKHSQLLNRPGISTNEALAMDKNLLTSVLSISAASDTGEISKALQVKEDLAFMLASRQLMTGESNNLEAEHAAVLAEKKALEDQMRGSKKSIMAPAAGTFVSFCDGYETLLSPSMMGDITYDRVMELLQAEVSPPSDMLGKVVTDYEWNFICPVTDKEKKGLEIGKKYTIQFPFNGGEGLRVTLKDIRSAETDKHVLVFSSFDVVPEIHLLRQQTVQIVRESFDGLRVNNQARRVKEGVVGVFVRAGMQIEFRTIEEVFSTESFSIVKLNVKDKAALQLYDEIVVEGKDLYDGKVLD